MHGLGTPADLAHFMTTDLFRRSLAVEENSLRKLAEAYSDAFNRRDVEAVSSMLSVDFVLEDNAGRFSGRDSSIQYISKLFEANADLHFQVSEIYVRPPSTTIIEFALRLGGAHFVGIDVCEWQGGLLKIIRAYVRQSPLILPN
jgi:predicted ester cyclase